MADPDSTHSTSIKGKKLLAALRLGRSIAGACRAAQIDRKTYYNWIKADPVFAQDVEHAKEEGTDALEDKLMERAQKNDTVAAIFILKARRPGIYRDNIKHEVTGADGAPFVIQFVQRESGPA